MESGMKLSSPVPLFHFDQNQTYEVDCEPFHEALRCHGALLERDGVGWLVMSSHGAPKIVVSQRDGCGIGIASLAVLDERMRHGLAAVHQLTELLLGKLEQAEGGNRDQIERGIVVVGKLLDMCHRALATCNLSTEQLVEASLFVTKTVQSAVRERDLRHPAEFWGLLHELSLYVVATMEKCREAGAEESSLAGGRASVA
jgi:hypothetical protein